MCHVAKRINLHQQGNSSNYCQHDHRQRVNEYTHGQLDFPDRCPYRFGNKRSLNGNIIGQYGTKHTPCQYKADRNGSDGNFRRQLLILPCAKSDNSKSDSRQERYQPCALQCKVKHLRSLLIPSARRARRHLRCCARGTA